MQSGPYGAMILADLGAETIKVESDIVISNFGAGVPERLGIDFESLEQVNPRIIGVMGILAALYERERSGKGQHVDISMVDCQVSMLNYMATMHFLSGKDPHPIGNSHFVHVPYDTFSCAYWLKQLEEKRIPCAPVNRFSQALSEPQVLHRNMVVELAHPGGNTTRGPGNPIKLSRTDEESFSPAPLLGQDTDKVLTSLLGLTAEQVDDLKAQGVIG